MECFTHAKSNWKWLFVLSNRHFSAASIWLWLDGFFLCFRFVQFDEPTKMFFFFIQFFFFYKCFFPLLFSHTSSFFHKYIQSIVWWIHQWKHTRNCVTETMENQINNSVYSFFFGRFIFFCQLFFLFQTRRIFAHTKIKN